LYGFQAEALTSSGLNATSTSVGKFVSLTVDRIIDKRLLAGLSWQGTAEKAAFTSFETIVDLVRGKQRVFHI
jgi:hypothetical protein